MNSKKYLRVNEDRRFGYSMKVEVAKYEDMWQEIKNSAMFTIGKDTGKYPNDAWKKKMLLSEHSPIRDGYFILNCYDILSRRCGGQPKTVWLSDSRRIGKLQYR